MKLCSSRVTILPEPGASPSVCSNNWFAQSRLTQTSNSMYLLKSPHAETFVPPKGFCLWDELLWDVQLLNVWIWGGKETLHFLLKAKIHCNNKSWREKMWLNTPHHMFIRAGSIIIDECCTQVMRTGIKTPMEDPELVHVLPPFMESLWTHLLPSSSPGLSKVGDMNSEMRCLNPPVGKSRDRARIRAHNVVPSEGGRYIKSLFTDLSEELLLLARKTLCFLSVLLLFWHQQHQSQIWQNSSCRPQNVRSGRSRFILPVVSQFLLTGSGLSPALLPGASGSSPSWTPLYLSIHQPVWVSSSLRLSLLLGWIEFYRRETDQWRCRSVYPTDGNEKQKPPKMKSQ